MSKKWKDKLEEISNFDYIDTDDRNAIYIGDERPRKDSLLDKLLLCHHYKIELNNAVQKPRLALGLIKALCFILIVIALIILGLLFASGAFNG